MSPSRPQNPLITVIGATGTGKSELAVALAERFNGEIVNGDALQMYEGLPIATNKIPANQRKFIPHHLLGCVKLEEEPWRVGKFTERATSVIEEIRSRGRLPILVGGTHYYTQSLLFPYTLVKEPEGEEMTLEEQEKTWPILGGSTIEMLEELAKFDPIMAKRWHPSDQRKIRRSLMIWLKTGKKASEIYEQQRQRSSTSEARSLLRYDPLIFWVHASDDALEMRLAARVDVMIQKGLLVEVELMSDFLRKQDSEGRFIDQSRGIWVAIGFKEFKPYVSASREHGIDLGKLEALKRSGIEMTKIATRQLAKRQARWIKLRFMPALTKANAKDRIFLLDGSDLSLWSSSVVAPASATTAAFLNGESLPDPSAISDTARTIFLTNEEEQDQSQKDLHARYCDICDLYLMTEEEMARHLKGKKHKKASKPPILRKMKSHKDSTSDVQS